MYSSRIFRLFIRGRHFFKVVVLVGATCSVALPSQSQQRVLDPQPPGPTRAEVIADLTRWQRAEMDRFQPLATSYGLETESYQQARLEYIRLTNIEQHRSGVLEPTPR